MRHQVFLCREVVLDGELKLIVMKRVLAGKKMQKSCTCWCRKMLRKVWVSSCETSVSHAKALLCGSFATLIIIYCHLASNYFFRCNELTMWTSAGLSASNRLTVSTSVFRQMMPAICVYVVQRRNARCIQAVSCKMCRDCRVHVKMKTRKAKLLVSFVLR